MKKKKNNLQWGVMLLFTLVVFVALWFHMASVSMVIFLLEEFGVLSVVNGVSEDLKSFLLTVALISLPNSVMVALLISKVPLKPIRNLIDNMDRLADGDFHTRVEVGAIMRRYPPFVSIARSFNRMAEQLGSTELLRSDFINNFSHEFKTPIVSIAGFARLLRRETLSREQQQEYLTIIEEESLRLSYMATNVLNLTKLENQTILSDVSEFNLSEQIRSSILLLENKWSRKELDFDLSLEQEHWIRGNEEQLKQVWINLIDNAVKFSPQWGMIEIGIAETEKELLVSVRNQGSHITQEQQKKIWNKFYQADESHAAEGNGVGLAIVKRIVELHRGRADVSSERNSTTFTITLPKMSNKQSVHSAPL